MTVHIIADSASDLPKEFFQQPSISFIPLKVELDGNDYLDSKTIEPIKVYEAMRQGKNVKTSQASLQSIQETFIDCIKKDQPALYVAFSSELSGTYQTAKMVVEQLKEDYPDTQIDIIDSKCASLGYGLAVKHAKLLSDKGLPLNQIKANIETLCQHIEHLFTVDDLEYLARGGRVSRSSAFVGGLLNIKPLLDVEDGKLIPLEKIRGRKKVFRRILELMEQRGVNLTNQTIAISHGDDEEGAHTLAEMVKEQFKPKDILINTIGAAIGAHSGPGTIAIFFLSDDSILHER
ncbi:DegV family protein [Bacillus carboniphilus]|uniref:DegV family protein n=1 Tax=Bacillus carboniphilus TaxID=86663 RepID=A0ABY9JVY6_9BACI|nr:DegV family protein [Bacillus carboniphilus]WLR42923.1 DegV family protein [Bacillus carboniphilus]